ncbi:MAG: phosphoesterase [Desulfobacterales bacterium]|nr:phosphoesterase [Desulfobacterales bacterium]
MNPTEQVLCIHRNRLPENWVETQSRVPMDLDTFVAKCTQAGFEFVDRPKAEQNPDLKQVIPYIVLQTQDEKETAIYNRQGSEARLHDLWSLGIGGHINPEDTDKAMGFKEILMAGMERELSEELASRPREDKPIFRGIISEDITDVGKVHLGAVFQIRTSDRSAWKPGEELHLFQWEATDQVKERNMELWSEMALELIS